MPSSVTRASRWNLAEATVLILGLAPMILMIFTVIRIWLPLPFWDEWTTPGDNLVSWCNGTLTWQELFSQHNESRKFFPRLLYLGLAKLGGWDVRQEMAVMLIIVSATSFLFYHLMRRTVGATRLGALIAWSAASFLCFSSVQLENFLWGIQLEVFFPGLAVVAVAAVNLSRLLLARKCFINALLALIATYTVAHGMLIWFLGIPLLAANDSSSPRQRWVAYGSYLLAATAAITPYFVGYHRPPHHPQMLANDGGVLHLAHYLVLWVGSYFNSSIAHPFAAGLVAISLFVVGFAWAAVLIRKHRDWRSFYPALLIAAYACATAGITALGRIGFGVEQALNIRYRSYSLYFYLAIVAGLFAIRCSYARRPAAIGRRILFTVCSAAALVGFAAWIGCYLDGLKQQKLVSNRNSALMRALEWIDVIPDNPDLRFLFPSPELLPAQVHVLRAHGILRTAFVSDQLGQEVKQAPSSPESEPFGRLETCVVNPDGNLSIAGQAWDSDRNEPPDCIVIGTLDGANAFKPVSILETHPLAHEKRAGFKRTISPANFPPDTKIIAAYAINLKANKAYPLGGATPIAPPIR